jgi:hypothetical protein
MRYEGDDREAPQPTPTPLPRLDVHVDGLKDFRAFLVRELDTNLKPTAQGISNDHSMGARFGLLSQSLHVRAARERYDASLRASTNNLAEYVMVAEVLIAAIHEVVAKYTDADLSAAASVDKVNVALTEALNNADLVKARLEAEHETDRESHRQQAGTNP